MNLALYAKLRLLDEANLNNGCTSIKEHTPWAERSSLADLSAYCCTGLDAEGSPGSPGHLADCSAGFYSDPPLLGGSGCRTLAAGG